MDKEIKIKMNFGEALELLKKGNKVCREGWNGKNMYIYLQKGSMLSIEARNSILQEEINKSEIKTIIINSHIDMKSSDGSIVIGWLASQIDMLAEDWIEVL